MKLAFSDFKSLLSLLMLSSAWQKSVWHMQLANHDGTSAEPKQHLTVVFRALSSWMLDNETKTFVFTLFAPPCARQISGSQACASQPHELQACMGHSYEPYKPHESTTFTASALALPSEV